jgi:isopenicillin N synthase-like dioxygenase
MERAAVPRADLPGVRLEAAACPDPRVAQGLAQAGAVVLLGHDVDAACQRAALQAGREAFALPEAIKARYEGPRDGTQRGYLPLRTHLPDGRPALDRKEAWHARPAGHPLEDLLPAEVPALGVALGQLVGRLHALAGRVLDGLDAWLDRPQGRLRAACEGGDTLLRISRYPGAVTAGDGTRFGAHQDFDLVTLLPGTNGAGLEIQGRDGIWRAAAAPPDGVLLIAGDLLAIESLGRLPATRHRVVAPPGEDPAASRLSLAYFVGPREAYVLADGRPAGHILRRRLREAGYA